MRDIFAAAVCITALAGSLKYAGFLDWPWWVVAAPIWIAIAFAVMKRFGN